MISIWTIAVAALAAPFAPAASGAETPPLAGCYERSYDAAHFSAHRGQLVARLRLSVEAGAATTWASARRDPHPIVADGILEIWTRKRKKGFDLHGACRAEGEGLICNGALSAAETELCKSKGDGVRDCRIDFSTAGVFHIAPRPEGVLVTIEERLELPQAGTDSGPYLYLSPGNAENHAFLVKSAPAAVCK